MSNWNNPEWIEEEFAKARPASEVHAPKVAKNLVRQGRPPVPEAERKQQVTLRLSPSVLAHFKRGGPGWQTRISEALEREAAGRAR